MRTAFSRSWVDTESPGPSRTGKALLPNRKRSALFCKMISILYPRLLKATIRALKVQRAPGHWKAFPIWAMAPAYEVIVIRLAFYQVLFPSSSTSHGSCRGTFRARNELCGEGSNSYAFGQFVGKPTQKSGCESCCLVLMGGLSTDRAALAMNDYAHASSASSLEL